MPKVPTQVRLKQLLSYDPDSGVFHWLVRKGRAVAGQVAGATNSHGYRQIRVDGVIYGAHRLAFIFMTGGLPPAQVDHIDGDKANNRWANLRPATPEQNMRNFDGRKDNRSGFKGVGFSAGKWRARIKANGVRHNLGRFDTPEEAAAAYNAAAKRLHGEYAVLNAMGQQDGNNAV